MNLIIVDNSTKQFDYFMHASLDIQNHIIANILKINKKNNTCLTVITETETNYYEDLGYIINQGLYDNLVFEYNSNLVEGEKELIRWINK
ncbi:hypothetical protein EG339_12220 [Chryseobacterium bernardetii]|uniref:Uncharacterized protein n=1 Tax=Chryseobacterium bernardetii TaxID=1241978 RepID=A0A3G6TBM9_9FLAO|nr:hypothetical protein EG339_12220 [Chryseobacterium bernardetii]